VLIEFGENGRFYQTEFQYLNGDAVADIVAWVRPNKGNDGKERDCELCTFSGVDGAPLW
jgi:hypothetical protein